jgi:hypothetical protein
LPLERKKMPIGREKKGKQQMISYWIHKKKVPRKHVFLGIFFIMLCFGKIYIVVSFSIASFPL